MSLFRYMGLTKIAPVVQDKLVVSVLIVFGLCVILQLMWELMKVNMVEERYRYQLVAIRVTQVVGLVILARLWLQWFVPPPVFWGIMLVGVLIVSHDILLDLAGGIYIAERRPFEAGHWVKIGTATGEIASLKMLNFSLVETTKVEEGRLRTGMIIQVPNRKIFTDPLVNYSKNHRFIWSEVAFTITPESDWRKAKEIVRQIVLKYTEHIYKTNDEKVRQASERWIIFYAKLSPEISVAAADKITLTARFLCDPAERRNTVNAIWEEVVSTMESSPDIHLATLKSSET